MLCPNPILLLCPPYICPHSLMTRYLYGFGYKAIWFFVTFFHQQTGAKMKYLNRMSRISFLINLLIMCTLSIKHLGKKSNIYHYSSGSSELRCNIHIDVWACLPSLLHSTPPNRLTVPTTVAAVEIPWGAMALIGEWGSFKGTLKSGWRRGHPQGREWELLPLYIKNVTILCPYWLHPKCVGVRRVVMA